MNRIFIYILFLSIIIKWQNAYSHSPNEIGLHIIQKENVSQLEVHLTSLTVFDILYSRDSTLRKRHSLNLSQYDSHYQAYFNEHLNMKLNDKNVTLRFSDSNLTAHDATILFDIAGNKEVIQTYWIEISGFDFYFKPKFTVIVDSAYGKKKCRLNRNENVCDGIFELNKTETKYVYFLVGVVFLAIVIGIIISYFQ